MTKQKLLIPLDGSAFSEQILPVVRRWFKPEEVVLLLLHVGVLPVPLPNPTVSRRFVGDLPTGGLYAAYSEELNRSYTLTAQEVETQRAALNTELRIVTEPLISAGYSVTTQVYFGDPAQAIIDVAQAAAVDLIAMTTHGRTGLGRLVMGSVAAAVTRAVHVPVLLWRPLEVETTAPAEWAAKGRRAPLLHLTVATDGSTFGQKAVTVGAALAKQLNTKLTLLVTASDQDTLEHDRQIMQTTSALVTDQEPKPTLVPLVGYTDEVVLHYLEHHPTDLLVIGPFRDRSAGSLKAIGTAAQRLVQNTAASVLMVKEQAVSFKKLLVCVTDNNDDFTSDAQVFAVATHLADALGAQMDLLYAAPAFVTSKLASPAAPVTVEQLLAQEGPVARRLQNWLDQLANIGIQREHVHLQSGQVTDAVLEMTKAGAYDLIITGSQVGAGFFLGTVADHLVRFAEPAVLVVRTQAN